MAVPVAIAGAGIAARGFTTWLAKKKAREAAARAAVRSTGSASIPNLVTSARPSGLGPFASRLAGGGAAVLGGSEAINAMTQQPNGGDLHPRVEAMERLRNPRPHMGMAGLSKGLSRNENYMANPEMDYPSQDPSYDASMTQEGQIQTMMEEMDGMNISEDAKRQIIADKLGVISGVGFENQHDRTGSVRKNPRMSLEDYRRYGASPEAIKAMDYMDNKVGDPFNTGRLMEPQVPMTMDKLREMAREESGAGYTTGEKAEYLKRIQAIEAKEKADYIRRQTGGAATPREIKMFMGRPY